MNPRSLLSTPLLLGALLAGCIVPPPEEVAEPSAQPPAQTEQLPAQPESVPVPPPSRIPIQPELIAAHPEYFPPQPEPSPLRVTIPAHLRESGALVLVSRLHATHPTQESVTPVAPGTQEFEVPSHVGDVLAVSVLSPGGELVDAVMVKADDTHRAMKKGQPRVLQVPQEYATIQAAVDAAKAGDSVLVAPGTYYESVRLKSDVRLFGSGAAWTVLDGGGMPGTLIDFSGASNVVVAGFTFQNVGVGNVCDDDTTLTLCSGNWYSAAIYADGHYEQGEEPTSALVTHNVFRGNPVGVLVYYFARTVVRNNVFVGNSHGFVANHFNGAALVANNVFWENTRQAIVSNAAYLDIFNNVVARSEVGLMHSYVQQGGIRCNMFFQNGVNGADIHRVPPRFELGQDGNVELDPLFISPETGIFRPAADSPLLDTGCFEDTVSDLDETRQDIGAYGGPLGRWQ
jgi:hypothetical protein